MSATVEAYKKWLNEQLNDLGDDVFCEYILGILEGDDETPDEKREAIEGILSEAITTNLEELVQNIIQKYNETQPALKTEEIKPAPKLDVNEQLAKMLEAQRLQTVPSRQYTEEEKRIKDQILAQYSQTAVSDEEDDDAAEEPPDKESATGPSLEKNTNFSDVQQLQKERREQARLDSAAKKQKDKEDREKQKKLREEKKEKRKTVKGERRR